MKKILVLLLVLTMSVFIFVGCSQEPATPETPSVPETPETPETPSDDAVKTGLAVITSIEKSVDATAEKDGTGQSDSVVVAVTVDKDGKIVKACIDTAQTKINFSKEGKITSDLEAVYKSKQELGTEYGVSKVSSIGKEWNEQVDAFADYVIGKTVDEVKGIAVTEEGAPTDAELTSSVTIKVGSYIDAIEKAVNNAKDLGATSSDTLGLGVKTTIAKSKDAGEEEGLTQAYSNYVAATFDETGKITSSVIDASQSNINFTKEGKITTDLTAPLQTKVEIGAAYGMIKASSIGKEWFEQSEAFSNYVLGKTVEEVKGISVNEKGAPADQELSTSVTVGIGEFQNIIEKAYNTAK